MQKNNCSKQKIIDSYYNHDQTTDKDILKHISACDECSRYYQDLISMGKKIDALKSTDCPVNTFAVKKIVNVHLSKQKGKKLLYETIAFGGISAALLITVYGVMAAFNYKAALGFYLILFINLPILLLPAILKRKELL